MVDVQLPAALIAGDIDGLLPFHESGILLERAIVAPSPHSALVRFKVASGLDVVIDTADKPVPVGYASAQCVRKSLSLMIADWWEGQTLPGIARG
jgi:hypothetical protein